MKKTPIVLSAALTTVALSATLSSPIAIANDNPVSPARDVQHDHQTRGREWQREARGRRTIDGSNNNEHKPRMNASNSKLKRFGNHSYYADGISAMAGSDRPSARAISNIVAAQNGDLVNSKSASDFLWQWGQFLDHDIDLTEGSHPAEPAPIQVPAGDPWFDPTNSGTAFIQLNRSIYASSTGNSTDKPRQQINEITGWIDASNVYGSDPLRASALRKNDGSGQLKTSAGDLLPFNVNGLPNAGGSGANLFLAGDIRANEQVGLASMHTLFVREHNRLAAGFRQQHSDWSGERIYQKSRRIVGAMMQRITYYEFLPALLGSNAMPAYDGYKPNINAKIRNEFSTAAYRFGHSALSPQLLRLDANGNEHSAGHLPLRSAFFRPDRLINEGGIEPILRGLAAQPMQTIDAKVIDDVRNFLFGQPGSGGFDLVSLNIQRGRDHGLPSYNQMRETLNLAPVQSFADISSDPDTQQRLADAYITVDRVDLWVGGLSEDAHRQSHLGQTFHKIVKRQFRKLRDGDRFWFQRALGNRELQLVESSSLADIIVRNSDIAAGEIPANVFSTQ